MMSGADGVAMSFLDNSTHTVASEATLVYCSSLTALAWSKAADTISLTTSHSQPDS